jgi:hypothetical protein
VTEPSQIPLSPAFRAGYTEGFSDGYRAGLRAESKASMAFVSACCGARLTPNPDRADAIGGNDCEKCGKPCRVALSLGVRL